MVEGGAKSDERNSSKWGHLRLAHSCLRGASRSATNQASITSVHAPIAGLCRTGYSFRGGGTASVNACRTARRCTPCRAANSRIDNPSRRASRRIASNNSTLDLATPDLHIAEHDMKIRTKVGPTFVTTRRPTTSKVTTQAGPTFAPTTGAREGDHTHRP
jgi:hypothetical protein